MGEVYTLRRKLFTSTITNINLFFIYATRASKYLQAVAPARDEQRIPAHALGEGVEDGGGTLSLPDQDGRLKADRQI